jgi:hypothetical protein
VQVPKHSNQGHGQEQQSVYESLNIFLFWKPQRKKLWNYCTVFSFLVMCMTIRKEKMFMTEFYISGLFYYIHHDISD